MTHCGGRSAKILFLMTLINSCGGGMSGALVIFFYDSVLNDKGLMIYIWISAGFGLIIGMIIGPKIIKKYGKKNSQIIAGVAGFLSPTISFFIPRTSPYLFIMVAFFMAPWLSMGMLLSYGIQADNMDYIEWKYNYRAEGVVASLQSFII